MPCVDIPEFQFHDSCVNYSSCESSEQKLKFGLTLHHHPACSSTSLLHGHCACRYHEGEADIGRAFEDKTHFSGEGTCNTDNW